MLFVAEKMSITECLSISFVVSENVRYGPVNQIRILPCTGFLHRRFAGL
jgi:hypothetical protein